MLRTFDWLQIDDKLFDIRKIKFNIHLREREGENFDKNENLYWNCFGLKSNTDYRLVAKNQAWKKSPVIGDNGITASADEIAQVTKHALEVALWDEIDTKDPEQLRDRTLKYLQYCIDNKIKPGNLGLYNAWGLTKGEVSNIQQREPNSLRAGVIKKSRQIMSQIREQLMSDGKINPVTGIFWQKNWDGLKDQQEVVVEPKKQIEADQTPEQVRQMLEQDIPIDVEAK